MSCDKSIPSFSDNDDERLIALIHGGNMDAFTELTIRYRNTVKNISRSYYAESLTADDWYQEGMIGLISAVQNYKEPEHSASFAAFASVCIKNRLNSVWRSVNSIKNLPLNNYLLFDDSCVPAAASTEDSYIENERYRLFMGTFPHELSKTEQAVFSCYLAGFSYKETAGKLDLSEKSVDNALYRVKLKLKKAFKN